MGWDRLRCRIGTLQAISANAPIAEVLAGGGGEERGIPRRPWTIESLDLTTLAIRVRVNPMPFVDKVANRWFRTPRRTVTFAPKFTDLGRSQETFGKREREAKRAKKKKEKELKKRGQGQQADLGQSGHDRLRR